MERILNCIITPSGALQESAFFGGLQGEHRATALIFSPDNALAEIIEQKVSAGENLFCRADYYTLSGECIKGEEKDISRISEPFWLTGAMTASGLDSRVVFHLISKHTSGDTEIYKAQISLFFEASPIPLSQGLSASGALTRLKQTAKEIFEDIEKRSERAQELIDIKATALSGKLGQAANTLIRAEKLVAEAENAKNLLSSKTEYVFVGGDAKSSVSTTLILDDNLSAEGENAVKSRAIAKAIAQSEARLSADAEEKTSDMMSRIEQTENEMRALVSAEISAVLTSAKLAAHPVGSLYWSENPTNPSELFGGSWVRIKDRFILAAGDEFSTVGAKGGETTVTLKEENMPRHTHPLGLNYESASQIPENTEHKAGLPWGYPEKWNLYGGDDIVSYAGGNMPHNNMPPYETYYCWKRTA